MATQTEWREHIRGPECWCGPHRDHNMAGGLTIWVHRDAAGHLPAPEVLAAVLGAAWGGGDVLPPDGYPAEGVA